MIKLFDNEDRAAPPERKHPLNLYLSIAVTALFLALSMTLHVTDKLTEWKATRRVTLDEEVHSAHADLRMSQTACDLMVRQTFDKTAFEITDKGGGKIDAKNRRGQYLATFECKARGTGSTLYVSAVASDEDIDKILDEIVEIDRLLHPAYGRKAWWK